MIPSLEFFGPGRTVFVASAPSRLDVMGGISDYSGSMVLEMPLFQSTTAEVALRSDGIYRIYSTNVGGGIVSMKLSRRFSYDKIRSQFTPGTRWCAYVVGCAAVLIKEKGVDLRGAEIRISSSIPSGRGISASAALEVSVMVALCRALDVKLEDTELPALCQLAENRIADAPCGVMDQTASFLGRENRLLPILCQPQIVAKSVNIPTGLRFVGIDSRVDHSVSGSAYTDARTATFMGYEIIRKALRKRRPFDGYLANITPRQFEEEFTSILPDQLTGRSFIRKFGQTIDSVTSVRPSRTYSVKACTAHPVNENARVLRFRKLLNRLNRNSATNDTRTEMLVELGTLMYESHRAYSTIGLGHPQTDEIVEAAIKAGPKRGVFGARVSGGGSGGSVCVLVDGETGIREAITIAQQCTGSDQIFQESSEGARWRKTTIVRT